MSLIEAFWADSDPRDRRLFLDEAAGRATGAVQFGFDIFEVELDFGAQTATVFDVLEAGQEETTSLGEFLVGAESYGDDPSLGDGFTQMQRCPPTFEADGHGGVDRT